jgi:hypothetical protein
MSPFSILFVLVLIGFVIWMFQSRQLSLPKPSGGIDPDLIQAVNGDRQLAERLLAQCRLKHPDKSERWYVEKVLYDLYRDRGGYHRRSS